MAITTFSMHERSDGTWIVCNAGSGRLLLVDGVLQPGLTEKEARDAADLLRTLRFAEATREKPVRH